MSTLKLIVMGMGGVGKSAITLRFTEDKFVTRVSSARRLPRYCCGEAHG